MRSSAWSLIQYDHCHYEKEDIQTQTQKEDHMTEQGEDAHLQAKERSLEQILPATALMKRVMLACPQTSSLQSTKTTASDCLNHSVCGALLQQPWQNSSAGGLSSTVMKGEEARIKTWALIPKEPPPHDKALLPTPCFYSKLTPLKLKHAFIRSVSTLLFDLSWSWNDTARRYSRMPVPALRYPGLQNYGPNKSVLYVKNK